MRKVFERLQLLLETFVRQARVTWLQACVTWHSWPAPRPRRSATFKGRRTKTPVVGSSLCGRDTAAKSRDRDRDRLTQTERSSRPVGLVAEFHVKFSHQSLWLLKFTLSKPVRSHFWRKRFHPGMFTRRLPFSELPQGTLAANDAWGNDPGSAAWDV